MLLIEADLDMRARHEAALRSAGYEVLACPACPDTQELVQAAVVLADVPSFHWLQEQRVRRRPPMVVVSADEKAGVTACLCGAEAWVPVDGDDAYLLDTIHGVLQPGHGFG